MKETKEYRSRCFCGSVRCRRSFRNLGQGQLLRSAALDFLQSSFPSLRIKFGWAERLHQLGVSPAPIPRQKLAVEALAAAMLIAATDSSMRQAAAQLSVKIKAENGVEQAVSVIHQCLQSYD